MWQKQLTMYGLAYSNTNWLIPWFALFYIAHGQTFPSLSFITQASSEYLYSWIASLQWRPRKWVLVSITVPMNNTLWFACHIPEQAHFLYKPCSLTFHGVYPYITQFTSKCGTNNIMHWLSDTLSKQSEWKHK